MVPKNVRSFKTVMINLVTLRFYLGLLTLMPEGGEGGFDFRSSKILF